jgi:hypothetical protein
MDNTLKNYSSHYYGFSHAAKYHQNSYSNPLYVKSLTPVSKTGGKKLSGPEIS